ncbi:hypothetical protein FACS189444_4530 [Spirochaetia bacterium]|nr:hypothetical protein FACS189444_4530 [Spirochaetia bacterium]
MMTLEQTVEIPADHRLFIEVPKEIPAGTATFRLEWIKPPVKPKKDLAHRSDAFDLTVSAPADTTIRSAEEAIEALCGLYAGVDTLDAYMERRHAENRYEAELEERA